MGLPSTWRADSMKTVIAHFRKRVLPGYDLLIKNILFIMAGYILATAETLAARIPGLTPIGYFDILCLASAALACAVASYALVYYSGKVTVLIDNLVFYGNLALYLALYSVWAYRLEELRMLALFNALIAPTIVITYTTLARSVMMSLGAATCQVAVLYLGIVRAGQPCDFARELFYTLAFVPAFAFVSCFAARLQRQKDNMESSNTRLEAANRELIRANEELASGHRIAQEMKNTYSFITGIMLRFDGEFVEYVNAGHPDLLHRRAGRETRIVGENIPNYRGRPLGIEGPASTCKTMRFPVSAGDTLLLYTDCITGSANAVQETCGRERLVRSLDGAHEESAAAMLEHVLRGFDEFLAGGTPEDDLTVIVARRL